MKLEFLREQYKLLKVNGKTTDLQKRISAGYFQGYGQFGSGGDPPVWAKAETQFQRCRNYDESFVIYTTRQNPCGDRD